MMRYLLVDFDKGKVLQHCENVKEMCLFCLNQKRVPKVVKYKLEDIIKEIEGIERELRREDE